MHLNICSRAEDIWRSTLWIPCQTNRECYSCPLNYQETWRKYVVWQGSWTNARHSPTSFTHFTLPLKRPGKINKEQAIQNPHRIVNHSPSGRQRAGHLLVCPVNLRRNKGLTSSTSPQRQRLCWREKEPSLHSSQSPGPALPPSMAALCKSLVKPSEKYKPAKRHGQIRSLWMFPHISISLGQIVYSKIDKDKNI